MTTFGRIAAVAACTLMVTGCGGGSTPSTTRAPSSVTTTAPHSGTPLATETLTIKYPATFHEAQIKSSSAMQSRKAAVSRRTPAYINASPAPYQGQLEIFVDGTRIVDATPSPYGDNGSQSFSLPIYATGSSEHEIVAIETENGLDTNSTILAIGETDVSTSSLAPGTSQALSLTMLQNTQYVGLMTDANDDNLDALAFFGTPANSYGNFFSGSNYDCSTGGSTALYPFSADPAGGFAAPLNDGTNSGNSQFGTGGVTPPTLTSWAAVSTTSGDTISQISGGYTITFNAANPTTDGGILMNFTVTSPALAIYNDVENSQGSYPGIEQLYANGTIQSGSYSSLFQEYSQVQIQVEPDCSAP